MNQLLKYVQQYHASDVHFLLANGKLDVKLRGLSKFVKIKDKKIDASLFHYLKFIANLDLGNTLLPQSGQFTYQYRKQNLQFRFAYLHTQQVQSGVLRILNNHDKITIDQLSKDKKQNEIFKSWTHFKSGLVLVSGPTGSGKSTTLHAILETISSYDKLNVISLEDPIEIHSNNYLQLQVNEKVDFSYEEGIKQLLRHDPDVIMIGEVRDEITAKMLIRSALSGHMVFTTIHAKSCKEAIKRLKEFGIADIDLYETLSAVTNQRIFKQKGVDKRVCIYEILDGAKLKEVLKTNELPPRYKDIKRKVKEAVDCEWIEAEEAKGDIAV